MAQIRELQERFGVAGGIRIESGLGSLSRIVVETTLASAEIYLQGAHVTHFQPRGAAPVLFLSKSSHFSANKPIRGGVPLVFPWFGPQASHPELPQHGFARVREWQIESCDLRADGSARIVLALSSDEATLRQWPFAFSIRFIVIISSALDMTLEVCNKSKQPFTFEEAMHSYLAVGDVRSASVQGLGGVEFLDKVDEGKRKVQPSEPLRLTGETDRIYLGTTGRVTAGDPVLHRTIAINKENSDATVVWNPWSEKARLMADFGDDEWISMLCVETANAKECAVQLPAGHAHRMSTRIEVSA